MEASGSGEMVLGVMIQLRSCSDPEEEKMMRKLEAWPLTIRKGS
jgi:hypothetical protein